MSVNKVWHIKYGSRHVTLLSQRAERKNEWRKAVPI